MAEINSATNYTSTSTDYSGPVENAEHNEVNISDLSSPVSYSELPARAINSATNFTSTNNSGPENVEHNEVNISDLSLVSNSASSARAVSRFILVKYF